MNKYFTTKKDGEDTVYAEDFNHAFDEIEADMNARQKFSEKNAANGYAGLDSGGKIPVPLLGNITALTVPYDTASSKLTATTVQTALDELSQKLYAVAGMSELTWSNVQKLVRSGLAPQVFSVGDQLICNHTKYGELVWDIIDFDHDAPTNTTQTHSMSLQLHHIDELLQFDASEALYHAENGLAAGTYHFAVPAGYDESYGGGKTYQFTLTKAVPAGGHLKFLWAYHKNASDCKLESTPSPSVTVPIESVSVTEGDGGTALTALNSFDHARFGNEKWRDSCARQWLNSAAAAGSWWTPQHAYDRPYSADLTGKAGFLNGMDADFLAVVGTVTKRTAFLDSTYEDSTEKFFLPSPSEIYGNNDSSVNEGAPYAYYADNSTLSAPGSGADSNRIKCAASGEAGYWWLRSTRKNLESFPYAVLSKGQITNGSFAYNTMRMAPVCNII